MEWFASFIGQKLVAPLALAGCLVLGIIVVWILVFIYGVPFFGGGLKANLEGQITALTDRIENPTTGYVAKLATAESNEIKLLDALDQQTAKIAMISADSERQKSETAQKLATAAAATAEANRRLAAFMAARPAGDTVLERAEGARKQILEDMGQ